MGTVSGDHPSLEFMAALSGGSDFVNRLESLQKAKASYEVAYENLKLGQAARDILDSAGAIKAEAESIKEKAQKEAWTILSAARSEAQKVKEEAANIMQAANDHAAKARSDADKIYNRARETLDGCVHKNTILNKREQDLEEAHNRAKRAEEAAKEAEKKHKEATKEKSEAARKHRAALEALQ